MFIYKIHSARLRNAGWKLTLPVAEARKNEEVVSLASSTILRWLDELNGITDADSKAREIKSEIKRLRNMPNSIHTKKKIKQLYTELDTLQFKPDYMCLIIDKNKDYHRACKGFTINGIRYHRLLGTNGGVKNKTIVFVSDRHGDEIRRRIDNGRNMDMELVPAKLEAYKALACSASIPVSTPNGILVVSDCETEFLSDVIYIDDAGDGEPEMETRLNEKITMDASDGFGLMLPSLAQRWSEELGLDYMVSGVNTRFSWEKGMVFTFDFLDFAERVAGKYIVKDAWGNEVDIRSVELILTTSMLKLWDSYASMDQYLENCLLNHYTFGVTKNCPDELESEHTLNYQFIQSYDLSDEDIEELIAPTVEEFHDVLSGDIAKTTLFLKGTGLDERNVKNLRPDYSTALMIDQSLINDPFVQSSIYRTIKNKIDQAKVGVIKVHGNYSIACGDPYSLCQHIFGMPITGLLKAGEIYNKYWYDAGVDKLACFRAPMSVHNNIRKVFVCKTDDAMYWYRYMTTCTLFNSWDTSAMALNGMDFDGDLVMLTDNRILVERLKELPALMCAQRKAKKVVVSEADAIQANIDSFGDDIGAVTNRITSMYEVQSKLEPGSKEYKELEYRIRCGQLLQQNSINFICAVAQ